MHCHAAAKRHFIDCFCVCCTTILVLPSSLFPATNGMLLLYAILDMCRHLIKR